MTVQTLLRLCDYKDASVYILIDGKVVYNSNRDSIIRLFDIQFKEVKRIIGVNEHRIEIQVNE